jgi:hypothetical protein
MDTFKVGNNCDYNGKDSRRSGKAKKVPNTAEKNSDTEK